MPKKSKIETPAWIVEGYDSPAEYNKAKGIKTEVKKTVKKVDDSKKVTKKSNGHRSVSPKLRSDEGKTFKIKKCPDCGSENVGVVLVGQEGRAVKDWECRKCKWKGEDVDEIELSEEEFLAHLDKMEGKE